MERQRNIFLKKIFRGACMEELTNQIKVKAEAISKILLNGNSVEIKRNTDGTVKVYEGEKRKR